MGTEELSTGPGLSRRLLNQVVWGTRAGDSWRWKADGQEQSGEVGVAGGEDGEQGARELQLWLEEAPGRETEALGSS